MDLEPLHKILNLSDLRTSADPQVRDVALEAQLREAELDRVLLTVDGGVTRVEPPYLLKLLWGEPGVGVLGLIERRVDVLALAEEDAVDRLEALEQHVDPAHAGDYHGDGPVGHYEIKVVFTCKKNSHPFHKQFTSHRLLMIFLMILTTSV